jgi:type I restriction enzyme S subunit
MSTATTHIKTDKQLVPALRFKEFEGDWEKRKLGEVSNFLDGRRKPIKSGDRAKMQGEYPYYGASGIIDYVNNYIFDEELILLGEDGENIVSRNSPLAFRVSGKCWINNHAHVIVPKEGIDIDFLTHNLERINYLIYNTGTAQPKLNQEVCRSIPSYFASYPEQQKIASFLSAVDEKIQQLTAKKNLLEQYKKGVMQKLFSGKIRFKDENGNDFPDWEEKRLIEINDLIHGDGDWILSENIGHNQKYSIIQLGNIGLGEFIDKKLKTLSEENFKAVKGTLISKGDILINRMVDNDLNVCLFPYSGDYITSVDVCWIRSGEEIYNSFISFLIQTRENQKKLLSLSSGSGRVRISKKNLFERFKFQLPILEEQQKIATYLSSLDTKIETVNKRITQTQTFKKGLLQQMFV